MGNSVSSAEYLFKSDSPYAKDSAQNVVYKIFEVKKMSQTQYYQKLFQQTIKYDQLNRALGCLFGSFIGDSLGSYCQFSKKITQPVLNQAMKMPGGGVFHLQPGQFTDDSQLAFHLLKGLSVVQKGRSLQQQHYRIIKSISQEYISWMKSQPFDIGNTCRKGINILKNSQQKLSDKIQEAELKEEFKKIFQKIYQVNKQSQSNGSLMRITPMAVMFACNGSDPSRYQQFIKDQIRLMHANQKVQQAGYLWVNMLTQVIKRQNNEKNTFEYIFKKNKHLNNLKDMEQWFDSAQTYDHLPATVNIGWSKIAWTYGMHQLYQLSKDPFPQDKKIYFKKIIGKVIGRAGDTDTNAAIVGGLLGAIIGFSNLPAEYIHPMLSLQFSQQPEAKSQPQNRPQIYQPFNVFLDCLNFIQKMSNDRRKQ